ncbi:MAG TPA: AsmA family protein [Candidatus Binatia bacterium]|nr:AsmA family protein [Candidatus Binatia bacterium]
MRKLAIAIVIIVVIIVGVLLALPHLIDVNQYRGQIQSELQQRLGRPVQLGEMALGVFPVRVEVQNVSIGDDANFHSNAPFAQVQQLDVSVKLLPLLSKDVEVRSLELKRPKVELIRNAQGVWNFSTLGNPPANPPAPAQPQQQAKTVPAQPQQPAKPAESQPSGFTLGELKLTDGQIAVTDYQKHQSRAVYDHIDLTLEDYAPGKPFSLDLTAHLPGSGEQTVSLSGKGGPVNNSDFTATPFKGTVKLKQVSLSGAQKFLNSSALAGMDAVISGSTDLSNQNGTMGAAGSLKLENAVVHGVQVGYPISADFDVSDNLNNDLIQIRKCELKLGSTPLSVNGTFNSRPNPAEVDMNVSASNASIEEAARLAAAFGVAFSPNAKIAGEVNANVHAQGPTDRLAFNGNVSARKLEMSGKDIPQPVRVPAIDLTLNPQQIQSNNFTATSGGTSLAAQVTLTQYTTVSPNVDASLKTINGKVNELLNIAKAYGVSGTEGMSGSGNISLDLHATGPIKNTNAMKFSGSGALQNASLKMPSLTQPLNVRSANLQFTQNSANISNLAASLGSTNASGNLSVTNFQAPHLTFALSADKLNVTELEQITGSSAPQKAPPQKKAQAGWSLVPAANAAPAKPAEPSMLATATGNGTISVGTVTYEQTVLSNVKANVALNRGVIQLNPLSSQIYGGQENGSVTVDTRPTPMTYAVNAKLTNVDANKMLSSVSSVKDTLYGTLAATTNITFATPASGDVAQTLNGNMVLNLVNGKIMKLDLPGELAKIGKFGGVSPKGYTAFSQMSGTFNIRNGVANTNDTKAALDIGNMAATGTINLVNQDLNMHVTAVLNKGFSQSVGGTGVGGYLNTALANKNGELVLPVLITGNMNHPLVAPDVEQIAKMKVNNLLPTAGGLLSGKGGNNLGSLVGGLLGGQQQQAGKPAPQQQKQQNNPVGSALDQLLGGNKKH